ncbi:acyltransferase family protein [Hirschia maritima]|uniref:acyltransferase family protein n=1 Tax=Hirschia maritima TaxID=1121961 RepID=UPI00037E8D20|nr:acyltransferase [Hirschia maritima]
MLVGLQNLRAVAAYSVVVFHILAALNTSEPWLIGNISVAAAGVDVFFVLSGFVMVYVAKDNENPIAFFAKRIVRIVPIYWLATLTLVAGSLLAPSFFGRVESTPLSLFKSLLFIPFQAENGSWEPILLVGWTLNMEMVFYLIFAVTLILPPQIRLIGLSVLIVGGYSLAREFGEGTIFQFYGASVVLEFLAGSLIAYALKTPMLSQVWKNISPLCFGVIAVCGFLYSGLNHNEMDRFVAFGVPSIFLVLAVAQNDLFFRGFKRGVLTQLGDSSYSAYLIHVPLISFGFSLAYMIFGNSEITSFIVIGFVLIGTIVGAHFSFEFFEKPMNRLLRSLLITQNNLILKWFFQKA